MAWSAPRTWVTSELVTASIMNTHVRDNFLAVFPLGSYLYVLVASTAVETTLDGRFLECNGVAVSRTTYSQLNTRMSGLSYPFGAGDGSTTFNLPDFRGRSPVGHGGVRAMGANEGLAAASRDPYHTHPLSSTGSSDFYNAGTAYTPGGVAADGNSQAGAPSFIVGGTWYIRYAA